VPARFATIVTLGLAALAGLGIAAIDRRRQASVAAVAGGLMLLEALAVPLPINQNSTDYKQAGLTPLPASIASGSAAPEVYRFVATNRYRMFGKYDACMLPDPSQRSRFLDI